jgi:NitT/TauT family transport system permease protein
MALATATLMDASYKERAVQFVSPIAFVLLWELVARFHWIDTRFWPAPSTILDSFSRMAASGEIWSHLRISLIRIAWGFALGAIPALLLGLAMGLFRWLRSLLDPLARSPTRSRKVPSCP